MTVRQRPEGQSVLILMQTNFFQRCHFSVLCYLVASLSPIQHSCFTLRTQNLLGRILFFILQLDNLKNGGTWKSLIRLQVSMTQMLSDSMFLFFLHYKIKVVVAAALVSRLVCNLLYLPLEKRSFNQFYSAVYSMGSNKNRFCYTLIAWEVL